MNGLACKIQALSLITALTIQAGLKPDEFVNPPDDSRPLTDVGVGGVLVFSVSQLMPYGDVIFNSMKQLVWSETVRRAVIHDVGDNIQRHKLQCWSGRDWLDVAGDEQCGTN